MEEKVNLDSNTPLHSDTTQYAESTLNAQPKHINSRHRALMRRLLAGQKLGDIAEELGMTVARASIVVNSPLFKTEMEKMREEINKNFTENEGSKIQTDFIRIRLKEEAAVSVEKLVSLRDTASSERVQQLSAIEILDRAGYKGTDKVEGHVVLDASEGLVKALATAVEEMRNKKDELPKQ